MTSDADSGGDTGIRLQKVLAAAGIGSRRACEELIAAGRVSVDGQVADQLGTRVDPSTAVVHVDGKRINLREDLVYLALNKPRATAANGCSMSAGSTPTPRGYCCSPMTATSRIG
jgi:16S rRNA U516 pseudouridylate synthase RsuA-like enzyme